MKVLLIAFSRKSRKTVMNRIFRTHRVVSACCGFFFLAIGLVGAAPKVSDTAQQIDQLLAEETGGKEIQRAPLCDDETFLRRAFLDLLGRPATQEDLLAFCLDPNPTKRQELIVQLLADQEFGSNWARYWRDVVMYRRTEDRALLGAASFTSFLTKQINENKPWSDTARKMITATGDVRENGDTGLIVAQAGMPEDVTSEVSRIFLGIQIQCAQCHDHPTDRWKREQFHHLAAFFPRVSVRLNPQDRTLHVNTIDVDFGRRRPNNNNRFVGTLEHFMPDKDNPSSKGTEMQPVFFLTEQKVSTGTKDADRRGSLADWITAKENTWFAKAFVNRIWSELVGQGFYEPIDDLGPDRECSAPKTVDFLAKAFTESGYDTKWLFQTVMTTQAYQRESRSRASASETPFAAACSQRLRAEQLFDSLISVLKLEGRLPETPADAPANFRRDPRFQFTQIFGYDPSEPREDVAASIPQALMMMNSPLINQSISASRREALGGVLKRNKTNEGAVDELYLNTLGRQPSDKETQTCLAYIKKVNDRNEAFEDILWSLINSTEFTYRK
jgi:hypothetical protein